ncbi:MAG: sugar kinase [Ginsengibacter sp.]
MEKVICFGELLLRFSPALNGSWLTENSMPIFTGGAELNVATALGHWNVPVKYVTALPKNYLSEQLLEYLRNSNIDTSSIIFSGNRIGTYYLPQGEELKHAGVIYDRAYSSFSELRTGLINWDDVLEGCRWLHLSAISPSLNKQVGDVCLEAVQAAASKNIIISFDLNYRQKLWDNNPHSAESLHNILQHCNVIMGNIWSMEKMLGINTSSILHNKNDYVTQAHSSAEQLIKLYPSCTMVANTFRLNYELNLNYYATLFAEGQQFVSPEYFTDHPVNKTGSGDAFMAGLIYSKLNDQSSQQIINFAAAAAFKKMFYSADALSASVDEVLNTMQE